MQSNPAAALPRPETLDLSRREGRPCRVFVRVDYNVPIKEGRVTDDLRIKESTRTLEWLLRRDTVLVLCSHLGRPKGKVVPELSLRPVAERLEALLGAHVELLPLPPAEATASAVREAKPGCVFLLENVRFDPREEEGEKGFARELASLADVYVNEAFSASHREHASVTGVPRLLPHAAGFGLLHEVAMLSKLLDPERRPYVAVLGGAKVRDKLGVVRSLLEKVDGLIVGGGMALSFLAAKGLKMGSGRVEPEFFEDLRKAIGDAEAAGKRVLLPVDLVVAERFEEAAPHTVCASEEVPEGTYPVDIGPRTIEIFAEAIEEARTVFWNGPMGVFEWQPFCGGTFAVAEAIARCEGFTVVGGGDTAAALRASGHEADVTYVSTGGGASLEFVRDGDLPGLRVLRESPVVGA
jgi:phosphoglycerate kinase